MTAPAPSARMRREVRRVFVLRDFFAFCFDKDHQLDDQKEEADGQHACCKHRRPQEGKIGVPIDREEHHAAEKEAVTPPPAKAWCDLLFPLIFGPTNFPDGLAAQPMMVIDAAPESGQKSDLLRRVLFCIS